MKKMLLVMVAGVLVSGISALHAQDSNQVTSVNAVGYYSVTIPAGQMAFITPVLEDMGSMTIGDLVGDQLPNGSSAYVWDRTYPKAYKTYNYFTLMGGGGVWKDKDDQTATNEILRGDAIWLAPADGSGEITVTLMGEVPAAYNNASNTTLYNIDVTDAVGYTYPVEKLWTDTELAKADAVTTVHFWNGTGYDTFNKFPQMGGGFKWDEGVTNRIVEVGEAFWVEVDTPTNVTQTVPYDL